MDTLTGAHNADTFNATAAAEQEASTATYAGIG